MRGINEHAISLLNYYIGLIDVEPDEFAHIDFKIRQILIHIEIHLNHLVRKNSILLDKNLEEY